MSCSLCCGVGSYPAGGAEGDRAERSVSPQEEGGKTQSVGDFTGRGGNAHKTRTFGGVQMLGTPGQMLKMV